MDLRLLRGMGSFKRQIRPVMTLLTTMWKVSPAGTTISLLFLILRGAMPALQLWILKQLIDSVVAFAKGESLGHALRWLGLYVGGTVTLTSLGVAGSSITTWVRERTFSILQGRIIDSIHRIPLELLETAEYQDLIARARRALGPMSVTLVWELLECVQAVIQIAGYVLLVGLTRWPLALLLLIAALPELLSGLSMERKRYELDVSTVSKRRKADYLFDLVGQREAAAELHLFGIKDYLLNEWSRLSWDYVQKQCSLIRKKNSYVMWGHILQSAVRGGVIAVGVVLVAKNGLSIGSFIALAEASGGMQSVLMSLGAQLRNFYFRFLAFLNDLFTLIEREDHAEFKRDVARPSVPAEISLEGGSCDQQYLIRFNGVTFIYPNGTIGIQDVSVGIRRGEVVALVGPNGAGKSTFVKLMLGLYAPSSGNVMVEGESLTGEAIRRFWKRVATVFQDYYKFECTVRENIGFGRMATEDWEHAMDDGPIWVALEQAGVDEFIEELPDGLDTVLGKRFGTYEPSEGQWQKLALARAFAREADVIVFDEPTASLDPKAEVAVFQNFRRLSRGKTGIFVTHRLGPARFADRVIVFDGGRVAECGTHDELMAQGGLYARMFRSQAKWYGERE